MPVTGALVTGVVAPVAGAVVPEPVDGVVVPYAVPVGAVVAGTVPVAVVEVVPAPVAVVPVLVVAVVVVLAAVDAAAGFGTRIVRSAVSASAGLALTKRGEPCGGVTKPICAARARTSWLSDSCEI